MLKRISDEEIGLLEWESATLDMSFVDDYKNEVDALLQAQLEADQKVVREMISRIEKKMFDIADSRLGMGGILKLREGTFRKAYKDWQVLKKEILR